MKSRRRRVQVIHMPWEIPRNFYIVSYTTQLICKELLMKMEDKKFLNCWF